MTPKQRLAAIRDLAKASHVGGKGKGGRGSSSEPSAHSVGIVTRIENGRSFVASHPKVAGLSGRKLQVILGKRFGLLPLEAQAAQQLHDFGYVTPETQAALERSGPPLPAAWRRTGAQAMPVGKP